MAHPQKKETEASHQAKLRRMTEHYGFADPPKNRLAPVDEPKDEGPEDDVGFGADSSAPRAGAHRPARKTMAANPLSTYKRGGRVKGKDGGGGVVDDNDIEQADINQKLANRRHGGRVHQSGNGDKVYPGPVKMSQKDPTVSSEPSPTPVDNRADGGRVGSKKHKGGTHVNIMIAPQGGHPGGIVPPGLPLGANPALPPGMPPGAPPGLAKPPMPMPPGGPPGMAGMPPGGPPPGALPPGLIPPRKRGGRVMKHSDKDEDLALIKQTVKDSAMKPHGSMRAAGGRVHMTAGSVSGEGRLEKAAIRARHAKSEHPQEV